MKVLQINNVYNSGSTGKIVHDLHDFLQREGVNSIVCYGRGQKVNEKNIYKTSSEFLAKFNALKSRITGLQYNGSLIATNKLIKILKKEKPDIVHLQCINGNFVNIYRLLSFLKVNKIKTVLTLHAEFMYTGSCDHAFDCPLWKTGCGNCPQLWKATKSYKLDRTKTAWVKMKKAFEGFENLEIVAVSPWLKNRAKHSPIMNKYPFNVIPNGIDTNATFKPTDFSGLKEKHSLKDEKILLHVTANFTLDKDDLKGGHYVVQLAKRLKSRNIKILVIGARDLSLELPDNIINVGRTYDQKELAAYYSMADLTILTSKRETYSMVCVESLSCGTPVVGFNAGGPETIALKKYTEFINFGDINKLESTVIKWINTKMNIATNSIVKEAHEKYSKRNMGQEYLNIYSELTEVE